MKKYLNILLISLFSIFLSIGFCTNTVDAQSYSTATGTTTGNGVCSLYPDSCRTDLHQDMGSGWSSAERAFTQNHDHFGWLGALQAESSPYSTAYGVSATPAVFYVNIKDALYKTNESTRVITLNDFHGIIGNSNDVSSNTYQTAKYSLRYTLNQVQEGSNYYFNYTLSPSNTGIGSNTNNAYLAIAGADIAYNNHYYSSTDDAIDDILNGTNSSIVSHKEIGSFTSANVFSPIAVTDALPTLYYNPTYDIFEGKVIYTKERALSKNTTYYTIHREIYVRAIFLQGGTSSEWISGFDSPGSLYNPNTGIGRTLHGVVNQLDFYPALFTSDQYQFTDGGSGESPQVAPGTWVQPNATDPPIGRIITDKYPSPLYGTNSLAMRLREYDSYYKGGKDILGHHKNSLILYMNVNRVDLENNTSEFDTYIFFFKDGDYVDLSLEGSKLIIEEGWIITGGNISVTTMHNGSPPTHEVDYREEFGNDLPFGLETIELLPHPFAVYNEQGLVETYWNAYEAAYNGYTVDHTQYLNIYCSVIGFNYIGLDSLYNAEDGYTMLDVFWPGASMSEAAGCESVSIDDYGKRTDGGPNVGAYINTTDGNSIYGQESYNQLDGSAMAEFASNLTTLDTTIDGYAETMKGYINQYTSFLQSDYPLMNNSGFLSTASSMKLWIDGLMANQYLSPFIDTVLLIVIVMIAIR